MNTKSFKLFSAAVICSIFITSCVKDRNITTSPSASKVIQEAKDYFEKNIGIHPLRPISNNHRALAKRSVQWQNAYFAQLSVGQAIVVPIKYNNIYVTSDAAAGRIYSLSDVTRLVLYRDSTNQFHSRVVTYIPDSNTKVEASQFTGTVFNENWQGNSVAKPWHLGFQTSAHSAGGVETNNTKEIAMFLEICTTIEGYNYAADDPEGGEYWSETSCDVYGFADGGGGGGGGIGSGDIGGIYGGGGGGGGGISASTIEIAPPTSPIADIQSYFHCFVNESGPDHTFSVQVCVNQPVPGTRTPWIWTPGGPGGSSSAGTPADAGHTFLVLTENSQGNIISRNVGFYPSGFVMPSPAYAAGSQGVLNDDESHPYNISLTINVSSAQFFGILNYVELGNNPGFYYNINSNNCTTFCINALGANGITLPATRGSWPGGSGDDPGDLGEDIRQMTLSPGMSRNTVQNYHPNTFSCN